MKQNTIIVDGYNVIHRVPRFKAHMERSLEGGREALLRYCTEWKARRRDVDRFYVVFDGDSSVIGGERAASAPGVRALYSKTGETADLRIRRMLEQADRREHFTVVSDDNEVRDSARVHHMTTMSSLEFARVVNKRTDEQSNGRTTKGKTRQSAPPDDLAPGQAKAITDDLRSVWGA
jgi:predicted RNA-binding protein with PIN domain